MTPESAIDKGLRSCRHSALHLEMRDGYMLDDPDLVQWRRGYRHDPADRQSWWRPWLDLVASTTARGVSIRRARVVSEPVSEYIRFEYDVAFTNVEAGERLRWLPRRRAIDIALPSNDFWLFDQEVLVINHFSGNGDWIDTETIANPDVVRFCAKAFEAVWERGVPHDEYQPT